MMKEKGQYLAAFVVSLGGFCSGTMLAWTSPALEFLIPSNNATNVTGPPGFTLTLPEEATVGAMLPLGAMLFAIPSGKLADLVGRKPILLVLAALFTFSWVFIACAQNSLILIGARFLAGMSVGGACVVCPIYIGEIADSNRRGILGSLISVQIALGIVYTSVVGTFTSWIGLTVGLASASVLFAILLVFVPETPSYLISNKKITEAKKSLIFLRDDVGLVPDELTALQKQETNSDTKGSITDFFLKAKYRVGLIAGAGVFFLQQSCGINVVVFYTVPIFKAAGLSLAPSLASIAANSVSVIAGVVALSIIETRSRKFFLLLSAWSMVLGSVGLALFFHLKPESGQIGGLMQTLPLLSVVVLMAGFCLGFGPVPWILISELYPIEVRGIASGLVILINWFGCFLVTFTYPILMKYLGNYLTFYLYGFLNVVGVIFIWICVPQTIAK